MTITAGVDINDDLCELSRAADPAFTTHRDDQIASVLGDAIAQDSGCRGLLAYIQDAVGEGAGGKYPAAFEVQHPYRISDALAYAELAHAKLAVLLAEPVAELVDRCLYVDPDWTWSMWEHQAEELRAVFERAGIGERYVPFRFESESADLAHR